MSDTKQFGLRTLLTVTTGRLLTESQEPGDNGIGRLYELLGWMTDDTPFTHQLPRLGEECKPWLFRWFPELACLSNPPALERLDDWLKSSHGAGIGISLWLVEQKGMFPNVKDVYDVPRIPADDHVRKHPYDELVEMRGTDEGVIVVHIEK
jgi:hypothetical protein